jgi:hypothetical protein
MEASTMTDQQLIQRYNYDEFVPEKFMPWMHFDKSPALGEAAPDFPLWTLYEQETTLGSIWKENFYTIVEFGSFT